MRLGARALQPGTLIAAGAVLLIAAVFLSVSPRNPPGFYGDESSITYNAATIAASGRDEYGGRFPLFIRSFGDYKSPVYVYLLAGVFTVTGPSTHVARTFSAVVGLAGILALLGLAYVVTGSRWVGVAVALGAGLAPWLFEVSRLVFEVSLEPLLVAGLLIVLRRASARSWPRRDAVAVGVLLAAIAYTYQAGKLLAVLYAAGIAAFYARRQLKRVALALGLFAASLLPLIPYDARHPGAIAARFEGVGYAHAGVPWWRVAAIFVKHFALNLNLWTWAAHGDPNERHHVHGGVGSTFFVTTLIALLGLAVVVAHRRSDPWWRFVVYGTLASAVPASLTVDTTHSLRMVALPVFLAVLTIPGIEAIASIRHGAARAALAAALVLAFTVEAVRWQVVFHDHGPDRAAAFDAGLRAAFDGALRRGGPIYAQHSNHAAYVGSLLYGLLADRPRSSIVVLDDGERAPAGATVVGGPEDCPTCRVLVRDGDFESYVAAG